MPRSNYHLHSAKPPLVFLLRSRNPLITVKWSIFLFLLVIFKPSLHTGVTSDPDFLSNTPLPYCEFCVIPPQEILKNLRKMSLGLITPSPSYSLILSINTSIILAFSLTQIKRRASNYFTVPSPFPTQAFCLTQWQSTTSQTLKRLRYFRYAVGMRGLK